MEPSNRVESLATPRYTGQPPNVHQTELQRIWEASFSTLQKKKNSRVLLGVASFLAPDTIPLDLFDIQEKADLPEELSFCTDESQFSEAIEPLLTLALINRDRDARAISCHHMVQAQYRTFMSLEERQASYNNAVALVSRAFPKQSDTTNENQLYQEWSQCNRCLQHVLQLKDCFREEHQHSTSFKASSQLCELLKDCQRYLYESNALHELEDLCNVNLLAVETLENQAHALDIKAHTLSHQASALESIGEPLKAIELNLKGYQIRLSESPRKGGLCGGFEQNLGYMYNTANEHETALAWFHKSRDTWIDWNTSQGRESDWPAVTKKNTARCLVYLDRFDEAEELLEISVHQFKSETPLNWAMLAYALFVRGTLERRKKQYEAAEAGFMEAQTTWIKGDQTRLHPFNAGCVYKMGAVCLDQGKVEAAIKHLHDSLVITKPLAKTMPVEHARSLFKLSEALTRSSSRAATSSGGEDESAALRDEAQGLLRRKDASATDASSEQAYDTRIPIFWR